MTKKQRISLVACCLACLVFTHGWAWGKAKPFFVTIGSGDVTGVYFPAGLANAKLINQDREVLGIRATVESTRGSVFNVNAITAGYMEFGLVQSDKQYEAMMGLDEWSEKGPQTDLRAVFSLHSETVALVAAVDANIATLADLEGKRVNLGNPGSGQYKNALDTLAAAGLDPESDIRPKTARASEAPELLLNNRIDAFFCTLGNPSQTLVQATSGARKVVFVPLAGPDIDGMLRVTKYYIPSTIEVAKFYPGASGPRVVNTFAVTATLCTSAKVPDTVVYAITKEVFDNLYAFKKEHPALAGLSRRGMLTGLTAPIHPGAIKYYREVGLME